MGPWDLRSNLTGEQQDKLRAQNAAIPSLGNAQPAQPPANLEALAPSAAALTHAPTGNPGDDRRAASLEQLAPSQLQAGQQVDNLPTGVKTPYTVTREDPQSLGMVDRSGTTTNADGSVSGWNDGTAEQFKTTYNLTNQTGGSGTMTFTGAKPGGGGAMSVVDMGNGGTVEGNVAALNRQTAALTSLREAQNPGITTGTGAFAPRQETAAPADPFGGDENLKTKYYDLVNKASEQTGFGASKRAARMMSAAQGLLAPGLEAMKQDGSRANSLDDLAQRQQITPYQQQQLALEQDRNGIARGNQQAVQAQKQQAISTKKLEGLSSGLTDDPRYTGYTKAKNYQGMLETQYSSDNPSDHARLALTVQQLARPESEPNDYTTKVLESSTGNWFDKIAGPIKQGLGFSPYSDEQRKRLYETGKGSFSVKENEGYAAINDAVQRITAGGGNPADYINPSDLQLWKSRQGQQQQPQQQGGQQSAAYRWDPQKGLVPQ